MDIKDYDFHKHDKLVITLRKSLRQQILSAYEVFKWKEVQSKDDVEFGDIEHVTLVRPHKIPNKDRVQYLQVCFEKHLDKISSLYTYKNTKSAVISSVLSILVILAILGGIFLIASCSGFLGILGYVFCGVGIVVPLSLLPVFIKIRRKENRAFEQKSKDILDMTDGILQEVKELLEVS